MITPLKKHGKAARKFAALFFALLLALNPLQAVSLSNTAYAQNYLEDSYHYIPSGDESLTYSSESEYDEEDIEENEIINDEYENDGQPYVPEDDYDYTNEESATEDCLDAEDDAEDADYGTDDEREVLEILPSSFFGFEPFNLTSGNRPLEERILDPLGIPALNTAPNGQSRYVLVLDHIGATYTVTARPGHSLFRWVMDYTGDSFAPPVSPYISHGETSHLGFQDSYTVTYTIISTNPPNHGWFTSPPNMLVDFVPIAIDIPNTNQEDDYFGYNWDDYDNIKTFLLQNLRVGSPFEDLVFETIILTLDNSDFAFVVNNVQESEIRIYKIVGDRFYISPTEYITSLQIAPVSDLPVGTYNISVLAHTERQADSNGRFVSSGGTPVLVGSFPNIYTFEVLSRRIPNVNILDPENPDSTTMLAPPPARADGNPETNGNIDGDNPQLQDREVIITAPDGSHFCTTNPPGLTIPLGWVIVVPPAISDTSTTPGRENQGETWTVTLAPEHTVTFDLNGGSYNNDTSNIIHTGPHGRELGDNFSTYGQLGAPTCPGEPNAVVRDNFRLIGWFSPETGNLYSLGDVDGLTVIENRTFVAQWETRITEVVITDPRDEIDLHAPHLPGGSGNPNIPNAPFTPDYDVNDPSGEVTVTIPPPNGTYFCPTNPPAITPPPGYIITDYDVVNGDLIVTLQPVTTVTFLLNGGVVNASPNNIHHANVPHGVLVGATGDGVPVPTQSNYNLSGWRVVDENGAATGPILTTAEVAAILVQGPKVFEAQWTPINNTQNYHIVFDLRGGNIGGNSANVENTIIGGSPVGAGNVAATPVLPGYVFGGWRNPATGNIYTAQQIADMHVTGNKHFEAVWNVDQGSGSTGGGNGNGGSDPNPEPPPPPNPNPNPNPGNPQENGSDGDNEYENDDTDDDATNDESTTNNPTTDNPTNNPTTGPSNPSNNDETPSIGAPPTSYNPDTTQPLPQPTPPEVDATPNLFEDFSIESGGTDRGTPPNPTTQGNQLTQYGDMWIELDDAGVPLGAWAWCEDDDIWIFDDMNIPLGAFVPVAALVAMPQTGLESNLLTFGILFAIVAVIAVAAIFMIKRESRKRV